ncbi:hypothetical protein [Arsukibacterium sp.]|uniref:hypothetical protein n=1 Tax=Arsukibacterium sp. TaxID=1977258 RepID=UPI00356A63B1
MQTTLSAEAVVTGTGQPWSFWLNWLNDINASALVHKDIVSALLAEHKISHWWAQMLVVQYEQAIGRRVPGQDCSGRFSVSVSKTLVGSVDDALAFWQQLVANADEFSGVVVSSTPVVSQTEKWRYWRCNLADGSRVNVNISQKASGKTSLSIQQEKLESTEQVEHWRSYWKAYLK